MSASPPSVSRRAALRLLGAAMLATVAGCRSSKRSDDDAQRSASGAGATSGRTPNATIPPAQTIAARVADDERELIAAYDAAIAAQPELQSTLAPLRADHAAHLVGLTPGAATTPTSSTPTGATPTVTPSVGDLPAAASSSGGSPTQSRRAELLTTLAARERSTAAARVDDVMSAQDGSLARLLASIGGCEAAHAALLTAAS